MQSMTSAAVREAFLGFFEEMKHQRIDSSALVPANDPTLLFTNAGMVQFKDVFLGLDKRPYNRATTSQKSMRVSGKHNDLENVGPSPRHHTFFEMLGNFSFGDYFKRDAIRYAYTLLTEVYQLPTDRLVFTVYRDDDEAYKIWTEDIGVDPKRVARMGPKTNFWQMAETGPCGPTSEIHWDKYPDGRVDDIIPMLQEEDDRFLEIWNLVFMQFNRTQADPDNTGVYDTPLPAPGVDTGMGLERIVSILQGKTANYETDLFMPIIRKTQALTGHSDDARDANIIPYRVIADHVRAAVFLIADGVLPGAKGRDSVCRLVIRRAARFGTKIGFDRPFLGEVADAVIEVMGGHYKELVEKADFIKRTITKEEVFFRRTLDRGLVELDQQLDALRDAGVTVFPGNNAFFLKATLGLPIQVTKDITEERGFTLDMDGYTQAEEQHALDSGAGQAMGVMSSGDVYNQLLEQLKAENKLSAAGVSYDPYGSTIVHTSVVALLQDGVPVNNVIVGDQVEVVLRETPFYVESGGQVSDTGIIEGEGWSIDVEDMAKPVAGLIIHRAEVLEGSPRVGSPATAKVDVARRNAITRNHTGTHLLHAALRNQLGKHVEQRGSLVAPDRLRFDFVHDEKVTDEQLRSLEAEINTAILQNYSVQTESKPYKQAVTEGAMALFGEKYTDVVRTVSIDGGTSDSRYSYELCGGVHVKHTAEIGAFIFLNESSSSAGVRRIEALTGEGAMTYAQEQIERLKGVSRQLGTTPDAIVQRVAALQEEISENKRQIERLQRESAKSRFDVLMQKPETIQGVAVLIAQFDGLPMNTLREITDWFKKLHPSGVVVLGGVVEDKPQLLIVVSDDLTKKGLHAGNIIREAAAVIGGSGGGRPNMAQAGGKDSAQLPAALNAARRLIAESYTA
ncbi:MAG: alanine--tRNA ligase [Phototrophicaceae bacterium]|jgi:alanyl-tRNA synthetase